MKTAIGIVLVGLALGGCTATTSEGDGTSSATSKTAESAFVGAWKSNWGGVINTTLVVHSVSGNTADITYTWQQTSFTSAGSQRTQANVSGNQLSWGDAIRFTFTERDGRLYAVRKASNVTARTTFTRRS
ncbi:hypothetical protein [Allomesorhizobium camelthorni]|uniref:Lipocalin-like domain-containing protein n=1 Tax=Allomesorhizobium camelthorni TaxID=475069 RepID=A0A6G4WFB4_9HYPH|nr:hypothetical protein [Mesorhizobium camelthorni]NGO53482.1 hypothetical protein [Mesorhizobium camelthorni]